MTTLRRVRLVVAWLLGLYLASLYVRMGTDTVAGGGFWAAFARWGYPSWYRVLIGGVEIAGGAALTVPWVASYGGLAVAALMLSAGWTFVEEHRWAEVVALVAYAAGLAWIAYEWWWIRLGGPRHLGDPLTPRTN